MGRITLLCAILLSVAAFGQTPDFGGTWQLDDARSQVSVDAPLAGLIGAGAPGTLHITAPANGTLVVESEINESHSRLYVPGTHTTTPIFLGDAGTITMMTRWDGPTLVSEGVRESSSAGGEIRVKETYALDADGQTLELDITISNADGPSSSKLRYTRIDDVGPCESWPSPCKDFSSLERR